MGTILPSLAQLSFFINRQISVKFVSYYGIQVLIVLERKSLDITLFNAVILLFHIDD